MFPPSADNGKPYSHGTQGHSHKAPLKQLYVSSGISSIMCRKRGPRRRFVSDTARRGEGARQGHGVGGEKSGGGGGRGEPKKYRRAGLCDAGTRTTRATEGE